MFWKSLSKNGQTRLMLTNQGVCGNQTLGNTKQHSNGKRIIEFFVNNGAVNKWNLRGVSEVAGSYHVTRDGVIDCIELPKHYTEMQLPEEFTPKRGDGIILT